ncbi:tyr/ser phosphatase, ifn-gamma inhibitor [Pteropox virus]|uniref:Tyr/ser phosphatase, ifn-gamma inhibitor n=1 Tax=Pteropox virus TaxID=1873698 RepID=A0A1B1MRK0_9POXV|nr:tyr/ser phosphatase, ifn-gamma inhibitor [Pteropox virus]ANS71159.1 tyr/ser phosphatase, ifn-gamma inhibitor [Pteropox virus]
MDKKSLYEDLLMKSTNVIPVQAPKNITKITNYIYLGNFNNVLNMHLYGINFKYTLNLTTSTYTPTIPGVTVFNIPIKDDNVTDVTKYFDDVTGFLQKCEERKMPVLVHCVAGVNRSGVMIMAYLMSQKPLNVPSFVYFLYVYHSLKEKRSAFLENASFKKQVIKYYVTDKL